MKKTALYLVALVGLVGLLGVASMFTGPRPPVHATTTCPNGEASCLSGWAWSDNVGWISFNSSDSGAGGSAYDVAADSSGNLTGYAWSPNIGWIKFGGLTGMPNSGTNAHVSTSTGSVTGWIRACAGTVNGDCSSMTSRSDGWDGWIELSGTNHVTGDITGAAGVTYDATAQEFKGYSWGSDVVGWLQFSPTLANNTTVPTNCTNNCGGGTTTPNLTFNVIDNVGALNTATNVTYDPTVTTSATVKLVWNSSNVTSVAYNGDWPSTANGTPTTIVPNNASSTYITFTGLSTTQSSTKTLNMYYTVGSGFGAVSGPNNPVTITLTPSSTPPPSNQCSQPANTNICGDISGTTNPATVYATSSDPGCVSAGNSCKFYCKEGYVLRNNSCTKSTLIEQ